MVLQEDHNIKLINTIQEKAKLLEELGIQHLILQEFTKEFANLTAEQFVQERFRESCLQATHLVTRPVSAIDCVNVGKPRQYN